MSREGITEHQDVVQYVYAWNHRKQQFTPRQIAMAQEHLKAG
jgi:hypothetical protein